MYQADQDANDVFELLAVPSVGGDVIQVNAPLVLGGDVMDGAFAFTKDSKGVVYISDQVTDESYELFVTYDYQVSFLPLILH